MLKIKNKVHFKHSENLMKQEGDVIRSIEDINKNKNLYTLLSERFNWMNSFIGEDDLGIEGFGMLLQYKYLIVNLILKRVIL